MHYSSGRWQLGLLLTLTTAIMWGVLPIALKGLVDYMDVFTITWFRFFIAGLLLLLLLTVKSKVPKIKKPASAKVSLLLLITIVGLLGNYIFYMYGLKFMTPSGAQVLIQSAPMLLLLGSLWVFKESFTKQQTAGVILFIAGLLLFFNQRIPNLLNFSDSYSIGMFAVLAAGVLWAAYALAQKQLLNYYSSNEIMLAIYLSGCVVFLPVSDLLIIFSLDWFGWLLLLFCGANTIIAYGAFAEALAHWEASRVSATLAIVPILTLFFMQITDSLAPGYLALEPINQLSLIGAALVVLGSTITALAKRKAKPNEGTDGVVRVD